LAGLPRTLVLEAIRAEVALARDRLRGNGGATADAGALAAAAAARAGLAGRASLRRVLNATGVVLHTNLGRAPLAPSARAAVDDVAFGYSNLEYDLRKGERGSRHDHLRGLLRDLTGAEDALVVNNN